MITGYLLLILITMPPNVPDIKLMYPAGDFDQCFALARSYPAQLADHRAVAMDIRCQPIMSGDNPLQQHPDQEHVD